MFDLVIRNANVYTMWDERPTARGVGVRFGRVAALFADDASAAEAVASRVIDAAGATVLPGFNDVHCHTAWYGLGLDEIPAATVASLEELYSLIRARANDAPAGSWVVATGYDHLSHGGAYPDIARLDDAAPAHPVLVRHRSGHACIVNTHALRLAGFLDGETDLGAGAVAVRDASGALTGLLEERAQSKVQDLLLPRSQHDLEAAIARATRAYASMGITSFTEAGVGHGWIGHSPLEVAAYQSVRDAGELRARAQLMTSIDSLHDIAGHRDDPHRRGLDIGIRTGMGDEMLSLGPTKVFIDGSMFGRTAAMTRPYSNGPEGETGYFQEESDVMRERILGAIASGWSIAAHAIGDAAMEFITEVYEEADARYPRPRVPHRVEHGAVIHQDVLGRLAHLGVVVVPQPGLVREFGGGMRGLLGAERVDIAYRVRSLLAAGMVLPGSSDTPVASNDVMRNVQSFVDRIASDGEVFGPSERIDVGEALYAYTVGSAIATGRGHEKGDLRPGKLADMVVLDRDPMVEETAEISSIRVTRTILGGETVFER